MKRKNGNRAGFTLVELIVVIVILGILAAVAVPAYGGYVKKAGQAADNQLLGAVNEAFAAACAENGVDLDRIPDRAARLTVKNRYITGVSVNSSALASLSAVPSGGFAPLSARPVRLASAKDVSAAFLRYFAGNLDTALQYYEGGGNFVFQGGVFVGLDNGTEQTFYHETYGSVTVGTEQVNSYEGSTYADMGYARIGDEIANVVNAAAGKMDLLDGPSKQDIVDFLNDKWGMDLTPDSFAQLSETARANALVLYTASVLKDKGVDAMIDNYNKTRKFDEIAMGGDLAEMAGALTMEYAMSLAYVNSSDDALIATGNLTTASISATSNKTGRETLSSYSVTDGMTEEEILAALKSTKKFQNKLIQNLVITHDQEDPEKIKSIKFDYADAQNARDYFTENSDASNMDTAGKTKALTTKIMGSAGFHDYINSQQGKADMQGFLSAMDMINSNSESISTESLLANGFADPELVSLLSGILG